MLMTDAILVAWTSKNSNNVGARSVSSAVYNVRLVWSGPLQISVSERLPNR